MTWKEALEVMHEDGYAEPEEAQQVVLAMAKQIEANRIAIEEIKKELDSDSSSFDGYDIRQNDE